MIVAVLTSTLESADRKHAPTKVMKQSTLTGKINSMEINASRDEIGAWLHANPQERPFVQDAFPNLSADEREFLLTGITPEEWDNVFNSLEN